MEPDVSIEGARMIRVAVVAVGNIPTAQLRDYVSLVLRHRRVELRGASSFYKEHQKSPFMRQPWDSGSLWFKFLVGGAPKSPWEEFQANRKCLGVIGLLHCPTSSDLGAAYDHFTAICRAYPTAQEKRCFAFFPKEDQVELDDKKRQHLALFPPNRQMLEYHMQTLMQDFAASLLMAFETSVLHADTPAANLTTPLDSQASLNAEEISKARKRRLGRIQKTMGDYCLLAGSPADANSHYATAIELAKLTGDVFWHAGAIEGYISALVVNRTGQKDQQLEDEVKYRYFEVIQLYHRERAMSFELEATLKLARFLCRKELAKEVVDLLTVAVEGSKSLMDASDRLVLNVEVARIFGALGYERKAAFYSRQVAQLYQQQDSCWAAMSALQVLTLTARTYRVQSKTAHSLRGNTLLDFFQEGDEHTAGKEKALYSSLAVGADGQWSTLQMDILGDMLAAAVRAGDPLSAWTAAARLIRSHYPLITPSAQFGLATSLKNAAERLPHGSRCSDPALPFVRLHSYANLPPEMEVVKRIPGKKEWWAEASSSGPFIYTPFSSKPNNVDRSPEVIWVVGEPVQVLVDLSNPCAFDVVVESICLSIESGQFEAFPVSVVMPPNTSQALSLSGIPLSVGRLVVRGCIVQCFGVVTEHVFQDVEDLVTSVAVTDPFRSVGGPRRAQAPSSDIVVMPPLPLLGAQVVGGDGAVVLYEGEIREMQIQLANAGVVPVVEATMTLTGKHREHVLSFGHEVLDAALPLLPGTSVVIPVQLKAGQRTTEIETVVVKGASTAAAKPIKDPASPMLVIYYAGPPMQTRDDQSQSVSSNLPPGRRLALPLKLHVLRGLNLVQARLLSMEVPAPISRSLPDPTSCDSAADDNSSHLVKIDPYRGSWGLLLLELELWNSTDVLFEITVNVKKAKEAGDAGDDVVVKDPLYPNTRIDQDHSARVLVPLERVRLPGLDKAFSGRLLGKNGSDKQDSNPKETSDRQARALLNATIEELSSRISVKWHSGRNCAGELPIKDAIREALRESAIEILLPDPLTFGFRLARDSQPFPGTQPKLSQGAEVKLKQQRLVDNRELVRNGKVDSVVAHELTPIEMLVRNNTREPVTMSLSVTCRDVTGASCLGSSGTKATVLWAGALSGVDIDVPALGEVVHAFALCFLVPGQYTLLGAAVINESNRSEGSPAKVLVAGVAHDPLCYSGPPFIVDVKGAG